MIINYKSNTSAVPLHTLHIGDLFKYEGGIFMIVGFNPNVDGVFVNYARPLSYQAAVNLANGKIYSLIIDEQVIPLNGELTVEEKNNDN
jgi:hypothetical protein